MTEPFRLAQLPGFADDFYALPTANLQRMVLQLLAGVQNGTKHGAPLQNLPAVGDLSDCRKIYFDTDGNGKPRYRLVYRLTPDEIHAAAIEAVAVGERANLAAYRHAVRHLGR